MNRRESGYNVEGEKRLEKGDRPPQVLFVR
jgi:hypothetical protein